MFHCRSKATLTVVEHSILSCLGLVALQMFATYWLGILNLYAPTQPDSQLAF